MSQFDTQDYSTPRGIQPGIIRANRGGPLSRQGTVDRLDAPGLVPLPAVDSDRIIQLAHGLKEALGITAEVTNQLGNQALAQRHEEAMRIARAEHDAAVAETNTARLEEGLAAKDSAVDFQTWRDLIATGHMKVGPGQDPSEMADQLIRSKTDGRSSAYHGQYEKIKDNVVADLLQGRRVEDAKNRGELTAVLRDRVVSAKTPEEIESFKPEFFKINPDVPETAWYAGPVKAMLESAADSGDKERFDAAMKIMGNRLPDVAIKAQSDFERTKDKQERQTVENFHQDISRLYNDGAATEMVRLKINDWRGRVPEHVIQEADENAQLRLHHAAAEQIRVNTQRAKLELPGAIAQQITPYMDDGAATGGSSSLPRDGWRVQLPNGEVEHITRKEAVDIATTNKLSQIYGDSTKTPDEQEQQATEFVRNNHEAVNDRWSSAMVDPIGRVTAKTTPADIGAYATRGMQRYRELRLRAPGLLARHVTDHDEEAWRAASALMDWNKDLSAADALKMVAGAARDGGISQFRSASLSAKAMVQIGSAVGGATNAFDVEEDIRGRARANMVAFKMGENAAVKAAIKAHDEDNATILGRSTRVRGRTLPDNIDSIASAMVGAAKAKNKILEGEDLTIAPDALGAWRVVDKINGLPATLDRAYSDDDLLELARYAQEYKNDQSRQRIAWDQRISAASPVRMYMGLDQMLSDTIRQQWQRIGKTSIPELQESPPKGQEVAGPRKTIRDIYPHLVSVLDFMDASHILRTENYALKDIPPARGRFDRIE